MRVNRLIMRIAVLGALLFSPSFTASVQAATTDTYGDWQTANRVGSWETAIDINEDPHAVITRVQLNRQGDVAIKL